MSCDDETTIRLNGHEVLSPRLRNSVSTPYRVSFSADDINVSLSGLTAAWYEKGSHMCDSAHTIALLFLRLAVPKKTRCSLVEGNRPCIHRANHYFLW